MAASRKLDIIFEMTGQFEREALMSTRALADAQVDAVDRFVKIFESKPTKSGEYLGSHMDRAAEGLLKNVSPAHRAEAEGILTELRLIATSQKGTSRLGEARAYMISRKIPRDGNELSNLLAHLAPEQVGLDPWKGSEAFATTNRVAALMNRLQNVVPAFRNDRAVQEAMGFKTIESATKFTAAFASTTSIAAITADLSSINMASSKFTGAFPISYTMPTNLGGVFQWGDLTKTPARGTIDLLGLYGSEVIVPAERRVSGFFGKVAMSQPEFIAHLGRAADRAVRAFDEDMRTGKVSRAAARLSAAEEGSFILQTIRKIVGSSEVFGGEGGILENVEGSSARSISGGQSSAAFLSGRTGKNLRKQYKGGMNLDALVRQVSGLLVDGDVGKVTIDRGSSGKWIITHAAADMIENMIASSPQAMKALETTNPDLYEILKTRQEIRSSFDLTPEKIIRKIESAAKRLHGSGQNVPGISAFYPQTNQININIASFASNLGITAQVLDENDLPIKTRGSIEYRAYGPGILVNSHVSGEYGKQHSLQAKLGKLSTATFETPTPHRGLVEFGNIRMIGAGDKLSIIDFTDPTGARESIAAYKTFVTKAARGLQEIVGDMGLYPSSNVEGGRLFATKERSWYAPFGEDFSRFAGKRLAQGKALVENAQAYSGFNEKSGAYFIPFNFVGKGGAELAQTVSDPRTVSDIDSIVRNSYRALVAHVDDVTAQESWYMNQSFLNRTTAEERVLKLPQNMLPSPLLNRMAEASSAGKGVTGVVGRAITPTVGYVPIGSTSRETIETLELAAKRSVAMYQMALKSRGKVSPGVARNLLRESLSSPITMSAGPPDSGINTATLEELTKIKGIGKSTAQAIIEARQQGPFVSAEDIQSRVRGVGKARADLLMNAFPIKAASQEITFQGNIPTWYAAALSGQMGDYGRDAVIADLVGSHLEATSGGRAITLPEIMQNQKIVSLGQPVGRGFVFSIHSGDVIKAVTLDSQKGTINALDSPIIATSGSQFWHPLSYLERLQGKVAQSKRAMSRGATEAFMLKAQKITSVDESLQQMFTGPLGKQTLPDATEEMRAVFSNRLEGRQAIQAMVEATTEREYLAAQKAALNLSVDRWAGERSSQTTAGIFDSYRKRLIQNTKFVDRQSLTDVWMKGDFFTRMERDYLIPLFRINRLTQVDAYRDAFRGALIAREVIAEDQVDDALKNFSARQKQLFTLGKDEFERRGYHNLQNRGKAFMAYSLGLIEEKDIVNYARAGQFGNLGKVMDEVRAMNVRDVGSYIAGGRSPNLRADTTNVDDIVRRQVESLLALQRDYGRGMETSRIPSLGKLVAHSGAIIGEGGIISGLVHVKKTGGPEHVGVDVNAILHRLETRGVLKTIAEDESTFLRINRRLQDVGMSFVHTKGKTMNDLGIGLFINDKFDRTKKPYTILEDFMRSFVDEGLVDRSAFFNAKGEFDLPSSIYGVGFGGAGSAKQGLVSVATFFVTETAEEGMGKATHRAVSRRELGIVMRQDADIFRAMLADDTPESTIRELVRDFNSVNYELNPKYAAYQRALGGLIDWRTIEQHKDSLPGVVGAWDRSTPEGTIRRAIRAQAKGYIKGMVDNIFGPGGVGLAATSRKLEGSIPIVPAGKFFEGLAGMADDLDASFTLLDRIRKAGDSGIRVDLSEYQGAGSLSARTEKWLRSRYGDIPESRMKVIVEQFAEMDLFEEDGNLRNFRLSSASGIPLEAQNRKFLYLLPEIAGVNTIYMDQDTGEHGINKALSRLVQLGRSVSSEDIALSPRLIEKLDTMVATGDPIVVGREIANDLKRGYTSAVRGIAEGIEDYLVNVEKGKGDFSPFRIRKAGGMIAPMLPVEDVEALRKDLAKVGKSLNLIVPEGNFISPPGTDVLVSEDAMRRLNKLAGNIGEEGGWSAFVEEYKRVYQVSRDPVFYIHSASYGAAGVGGREGVLHIGDSLITHAMVGDADGDKASFIFRRLTHLAFLERVSEMGEDGAGKFNLKIKDKINIQETLAGRKTNKYLLGEILEKVYQLNLADAGGDEDIAAAFTRAFARDSMEDERIFDQFAIARQEALEKVGAKNLGTVVYERLASGGEGFKVVTLADAAVTVSAISAVKGATGPVDAAVMNVALGLSYTEGMLNAVAEEGLSEEARRYVKPWALLHRSLGLETPEATREFGRGFYTVGKQLSAEYSQAHVSAKHGTLPHYSSYSVLLRMAKLTDPQFAELAATGTDPFTHAIKTLANPMEEMNAILSEARGILEVRDLGKTLSEVDIRNVSEMAEGLAEGVMPGIWRGKAYSDLAEVAEETINYYTTETAKKQFSKQLGILDSRGNIRGRALEGLVAVYGKRAPEVGELLIQTSMKFAEEGLTLAGKGGDLSKRFPIGMAEFFKVLQMQEPSGAASLLREIQAKSAAGRGYALAIYMAATQMAHAVSLEHSGVFEGAQNALYAALGGDDNGLNEKYVAALIKATGGEPPKGIPLGWDAETHNVNPNDPRAEAIRKYGATSVEEAGDDIVRPPTATTVAQEATPTAAAAAEAAPPPGAAGAASGSVAEAQNRANIEASAATPGGKGTASVPMDDSIPLDKERPRVSTGASKRAQQASEQLVDDVNEVTAKTVLDKLNAEDIKKVNNARTIVDDAVRGAANMGTPKWGAGAAWFAGLAVGVVGIAMMMSGKRDQPRQDPRYADRVEGASEPLPISNWTTWRPRPPSRIEPNSSSMGIRTDSSIRSGAVESTELAGAIRSVSHEHRDGRVTIKDQSMQQRRWQLHRQLDEYQTSYYG